MDAVGERLRLSAKRAMANPVPVDALSGARLAEIVCECAGALSQLQRELPGVAWEPPPPTEAVHATLEPL